VVHCVDEIVERTRKAPNLLNLIFFEYFVLFISTTLIGRKDHPHPQKLKDNVVKNLEILKTLPKRKYSDVELDSIAQSELMKNVEKTEKCVKKENIIPEKLKRYIIRLNLEFLEIFFTIFF
jgi:hypothetical protein